MNGNSIIKVNSFNDVAKDTLDEWIYYLKNNRLPDHFTAPGLEKAEKILNYHNMDAEAKALYDAHIKDRRISYDVLETARIEGREEGREEGEELGLKRKPSALSSTLISRASPSPPLLSSPLSARRRWRASLGSRGWCTCILPHLNKKQIFDGFCPQCLVVTENKRYICAILMGCRIFATLSDWDKTIFGLPFLTQNIGFIRPKTTHDWI